MGPAAAGIRIPNAADAALPADAVVVALGRIAQDVYPGLEQCHLTVYRGDSE